MCVNYISKFFTRLLNLYKRIDIFKNNDNIYDLMLLKYIPKLDAPISRVIMS